VTAKGLILIYIVFCTMTIFFMTSSLMGITQNKYRQVLVFFLIYLEGTVVLVYIKLGNILI